jgi:serine/threonine-protein kinase RsbW
MNNKTFRPEIITLEIPSAARYVSVPRKALEGIVSGLSLTEEEIDDIKLAVGEASANAIKFSSPDNPSVVVKYCIQNNVIEIEVRNKGQVSKDKLTHIRKPPIKRLHEGGLGLYLIKRVMDELHIYSNGTEITVKMIKRIKR